MWSVRWRSVRMPVGNEDYLISVQMYLEGGAVTAASDCGLCRDCYRLSQQLLAKVRD